MIKKETALGMFRNYTDDLLDSYRPDNITKSFPISVHSNKFNKLPIGNLYEEYDFAGKQLGYSWNHGDTINLEFSIEGEITIESDAIISTEVGDTPEGLNVSLAGKRYYNLVEFRSWTSYVVNGTGFWVEDSEFKYPENGNNLQLVHVPSDKYLENKSVTVTLYNFRMEPIHVWNPKVHNSKIVCSVTEDISKKLVKSVYYCTVTIKDNISRYTIFDHKDCIFVVK